MSNSDNPHDLTFPYPKQGTVVRSSGEGCTNCQRQGYCPAVYFYYRYGERTLTPDIGRACLEYSTNPADKNSEINDPDLDEEEYIYIQGIGEEAN